MATEDVLELPITEDPCSIELSPIHEAALTVTSELSLPKVLQKIVHLARDLAQTRYAVLGIPGPTGTLEQFLVSGKSDHALARVDQWTTNSNGLLREILESGRSLRAADIGAYPGVADFASPNTAPVSFMGVPIIARGEPVGVLALTEKLGADTFCDSDQQALEMLAAYAAVAIQNAKLYQQVQRLAVLEERERIGMDLHDGIIQSIYAVGLTLEHGAMLLDEAPQDAHTRIQTAITGLNQIIRDIRNYILDLRPQKMRPDDLVGSLRRIVEEFRANTLVDITLDLSPSVEERIGEATSTALFLIAQEALANAAKHANATELSIRVRRLDRRHMVLTVQDNGIGFDTGMTEAVVGHGLSNMQLRAYAVGGDMQIESTPGHGTTITATLPTSLS